MILDQMLSKRKFIKLSALSAFTGFIPSNALAKTTNIFTNLIKKSGFEILNLEDMYLPNTPKIAGYNYWGTALKKS